MTRVNTRAMTLLEIVLSIGMLSMLAVAAVSWTTDAVRSSEKTAMRARWESAAERTIDLIERDLRLGDSTRRDQRADETPNWIEVSEASLSVAVRAPPFTGDETAEYLFDARQGIISRTLKSSEKPQMSSRLLLGSIERVRFELIHGDASDESRWVCKVALISPESLRVERDLPLTSEGLP